MNLHERRDGSKVMMRYPTKKQVRAGYLANHERGCGKGWVRPRYMDPDEDHSKTLCSILEGADYEPLSVGSLSDARANLETKLYGALLIDLDHSALDNRFLKELRQAHPGLCPIGLSSRSFHPEFAEALSRHIDACFGKSAEYEDLLYWLRAVFDPSIHKGRGNEGSGGESRERS